MTVNEEGCGSNSKNNFEQCNLDLILTRIGQFGKFQIRYYALIIPPMIFNAYFMFSYIFVASSVIHRCRVPECDKPTSVYDEVWTNISIPSNSNGALDKCTRFVPDIRDSDMCFADNFDRNSRESCGKDFIFRDNELSISNDFHIYCSDEWKLSMVGTISVAGQLIGSPVGGYFSDRYGRRTLVAFGGTFSAILGLIRSFSSNYYIFLTLAFLEHICGAVIFATLFIIALEIVDTKTRALSCLILSVFYTVGEILLAVIAKSVHNWRWILRLAYAPALAHIALLWFLPESVRWLLSRGKEEKATRILQNAAKLNKRKLSNTTIENLLIGNRYQLGNTSIREEFPIKKAVQAFPWRIMNCMFCWFANLLVYHGLNLNSVLLGGNKYDNFIYSSLVEFPANVIFYFTMNRFGRRCSLFWYLMICGLCLTTTIFIPEELHIVQLSMFLVGKMAITVSFQILTVFNSEMFPTNVRNSLLSFCMMFGKVGSMIAPQTVLLAKLNKSAPSILFSIVALVAGFMALLFPETIDNALPSTIGEAEEIGHIKKETKQ